MRYRQAKIVSVAAAIIALAGCGASATTAGGASAGSAATGSTSAGKAQAVATNAPAGSGGVAGSGTVKAACPSAAEASSALGQTYPAPKQSTSSEVLTCTYTNSAGNVLVVLFTPAPNVNGADLKTAMDAQAKGQKTTDNAVSGLGDAAYEFSSSTSGTVQTIVDMLADTENIVITSQVSPARTETLAHDILGG